MFFDGDWGCLGRGLACALEVGRREAAFLPGGRLFEMGCGGRGADRSWTQVLGDGGLEGITIVASPDRGLIGSSAEETRCLGRLIDGAESSCNGLDFLLAEL